MRVQVNLRELEEEALPFKGEVSPVELELADYPDELVHVREPLRYEIEVEKQEANLLVSGKLSLKLNCECKRCLKPIEREVLLKPYHAYVPLEGEDAAVVANDLVDLTPFFREDVLLAFPQHPLCSEDCAGLANASGPKMSEPDTTQQGNDNASAWAELNKLKF